MRRSLDTADYYVDSCQVRGTSDVHVMIEREGDGIGMTIPVEIARKLVDRMTVAIRAIEEASVPAAVGDDGRET